MVGTGLLSGSCSHSVESVNSSVSVQRAELVGRSPSLLSWFQGLTPAIAFNETPSSDRTISTYIEMEVSTHDREPQHLEPHLSPGTLACLPPAAP